MKRKKGFKLEKEELLYAVAGFAFLITWFFFVKDWINVNLINIKPYFAMLIYYTGFIIALLILSNILSGKVKKYKYKIVFIVILVLIATDLLGAPYLVSREGVISTEAELSFVKPDVGFSTLYQDLGVPQDKIWFMTYPVTIFIFMFMIPILLLNKKQIAKIINDWK